MSLVPSTTLEHVRNQGGMTFDRYKQPIKITDGYIVAIESVTITDSLEEAWAELAYHFWPTEHDLNYLGFWQDPDTGKWYVDFVIHTYSLKYALEIANDRNELAIYDCKNGTSINV
jgi:hypothetical protein